MTITRLDKTIVDGITYVIGRAVDKGNIKYNLYKMVGYRLKKVVQITEYHRFVLSSKLYLYTTEKGCTKLYRISDKNLIESSTFTTCVPYDNIAIDGNWLILIYWNGYLRVNLTVVTMTSNIKTHDVIEGNFQWGKLQTTDINGIFRVSEDGVVKTYPSLDINRLDKTDVENCFVENIDTGEYSYTDVYKMLKGV